MLHGYPPSPPLSFVSLTLLLMSGFEHAPFSDEEEDNLAKEIGLKGSPVHEASRSRRVRGRAPPEEILQEFAMLVMDHTSKAARSSHPDSISIHEQSGYEPSDTDSEWHEIPWHEPKNRTKAPDPGNTTIPFQRRQKRTSKPSETIPVSRRLTRPSFNQIIHGDGSSLQRKTGQQTQHNQITPPKSLMHVDKYSQPRIQGVPNFSNKSNYIVGRSKTVQQTSSGSAVHNGTGMSSIILGPAMTSRRSSSAYTRNSPGPKINEMMVSNTLMHSIESIGPGDIFFSRGGADLQEIPQRQNRDSENYLAASQCKGDLVKKNVNANQQLNRGIGGLISQSPCPLSVSPGLTVTNTGSTSATSLLTGAGISHVSFKVSPTSRKLCGCLINFATNRQGILRMKNCLCRNLEPPETRAINEAAFIEKAFVIEDIRLFWADKYSPRSLSEFSCHKKQAQILQKLIFCPNFPHMLFKGPSGSGKKSLCKALVHDIFGESSWKISHDLRHFYFQDSRPVQISIPLTSSPHHVELNLKTEPKKCRYALMGLIKEITDDHELPPEESATSFKAEYKVIILYGVDKLAENDQHLIKWIMDCYTDACKIMLCCEDDKNLLDSIKSHCKVIAVHAPETCEIMEVLGQIEKKEKFELPVSFAARIATKSKKNMRRAIMALEACKAHNYPFLDEQPIPLGWEEDLVELASDILADPSPTRLLLSRGMFQKLLLESVHPKLILQKLVEQFLKGIEACLKRELYYWHAYYNKRLPIGTSALLKLEEFMAKFVSIYRKSSQVTDLEELTVSETL